jgi:hypothetical protein
MREWRKLHNEELRDLYSLPNIVRVVKSRRIRWAGHVARMGEGRGVYGVLVGRPEGKRPLGRPRRRWEDNINCIIAWLLYATELALYTCFSNPPLVLRIIPKDENAFTTSISIICTPAFLLLQLPPLL